MDLLNLKRKDTSYAADVEIGDLIKVCIEKADIFGIVLSLDDQSMELQTSDGRSRRFSRYVIYEKIQ